MKGEKEIKKMDKTYMGRDTGERNPLFKARWSAMEWIL